MTNPISCKEVETRLSSILAGEVDGSDAGALDEHLARCPSCEGRAAKFFLQHRALAELAAEQSMETLLHRVRAGLPAPRRQLRRISLAAACLLAAAALFLLLRPSRVETPEPTAEVKPQVPSPERELPKESPERGAERPEKSAVEAEKAVAEAPQKPAVAPRPKPRPPEPTVRKEPEPPAPKPEAPVEKPVVQELPPPPPTVAAVATFEEVSGEVNALDKTGPRRIQAGQPLPGGSGIQTVGPLSFARLKFADGTLLDVWGDTGVREVVEGQGPGRGKRVFVEKGTVVADVMKQPSGRSMILATPQGEARVLGTLLSIHVDAGATRVEVEEGKVEVQRASDRRVVSVSSGHSAVAAEGAELVARPFFQQGKKKGPANPPKVDPAKVDEAVKKGVAFLRARFKAGDDWEAGSNYGGIRFEPLVLWTFVHAGIPESDPDFQALLQKVLERPLQRTYEVSLLAMILEELDRVKYQERIAQCAQFLVDNQGANGGWSYGKPSPFADKMTPTGTGNRPRTFSPASSDSGSRVKPRVVRKVPVQKRGEGSDGGDNSNSQYAALGMRACHDAGIVFPRDVIDRAIKYWQRVQKKDAEGAGWCYCREGCAHEAYGSMTAGALGSVVIYHHILNEPWMKDEAVVKGLEWMARNFTVTENPKCAVFGNTSAFHHRYFLYAFERFGTLYGTETFGTHEWYVEGANELFRSQRADGAWVPKSGQSVWDTCFAILFLKRATRPLVDVATVDPVKRR